MKIGLINSVYFDTEIDPFTTGLTLAKKIGFDTIDIYPPDGEMSADQVAQTLKVAKDANLPIVSLPLILFGLFDPNKSCRMHSIALGKRVVDLAGKLDAKNVLLVNGEYFWQLETGFNQEWIWQRVVEGVREIGEYAKQAGIQITIELEPFQRSIIRDIDSMRQFLDSVDLPGTVVANIDCSHLHLAGCAPERILELKGRIGHVHFSDALDKHGDLPPGLGGAPLVEYLKHLNQAGFTGSVTIELEWPPDRTASGVEKWVSEAYRATAELFKAGGVSRQRMPF